MGYTNYPDGVSSFGIPVIGGGVQIPVTSGSYFWVDSGHAKVASTNPGTFDFPLATVDQAVGKCTAAAGDVILLAPGHAENIASATSLVVDITGVQIIGLGHGRNRPILTFTATGGSIEIDAANVRMSNMVLLASVSAVVVGVNVDANDVTLDNLEFNFDETGDDFVIGIDADTVDRLTIHDCEFIAEETAGADHAIRLDTTHGVQIFNCSFTGDYTAQVIVGEGALGKGIEIFDNRFYNADTALGQCIGLGVAFTGMLVNNDMGTVAVVAPDTLFDPGSCGCSDNTASSGVDNNAVPVPVTGMAPWRVVKKASSAFDGGTLNAHGDFDGTSMPYTLFTATGDVEAKVVGIVNTTLVGAATLEVGVAGNTAQFIAQVANATTLADGDVWTDAGTEPGADVWPEQAQIINDGADIIETAGTANITAGQIDYYCLWRPLEAGAFIVAA